MRDVMQEQMQELHEEVSQLRKKLVEVEGSKLFTALVASMSCLRASAAFVGSPSACHNRTAPPAQAAGYHTGRLRVA